MWLRSRLNLNVVEDAFYMYLSTKITIVNHTSTENGNEVMK
jgi:hypothetical protein